MGAYYGLINHTKGHKVSSYWKGSPPGTFELRLIAELFGWDLTTDVIGSYAYNGGYTYSSKKDEWVKVRIEDIYDEPPKKYWQHVDCKCTKICDPNIMPDHWYYFTCDPNIMPDQWNYFTIVKVKPKQVNKIEYIKLGVKAEGTNDEEFEKSHGPEYVEEKYYEYLNRNRIIEDYTSSSIDKEKIFAELHDCEKDAIQDYVYYFKGYTSDVSKNIELSKKSFSPTFFCN